MQGAVGQTAIWYDGKSAVQYEVVVFRRTHAKELRICLPGQVNDVTPATIWKISSIRLISGKLSDTDQPLSLRLEPDEGQRLVFNHAESIRAVSSWLEQDLGREKRSRVRRWLAVTAAIWAVCLLLYLGSAPLFAFVAKAIPQSWEESMGRSSREGLIAVLKRIPGTGTRGICEVGTQSQELQALLETLIKGAPIYGYKFDLVVLDADFVNAFALPGGYMAVSTGLIRHCESPDELAGVLAHEMAHVTERHGTGGMLRQYAWETFLRLLGLSDGMTGAIAQLVISSSFSRDDERAADARGAERLMRAGINPMGMADFFGRLADGEGKDASGLYSYISSHPALEERRENIRRLAGAQGENSPQGAAYAPAMGEAAWARLRSLCPKPEKDEEKTGGPHLPPAAKGAVLETRWPRALPLEPAGGNDFPQTPSVGYVRFQSESDLRPHCEPYMNSF